MATKLGGWLHTIKRASFHKVTSLLPRGLVKDFDFSYTIYRFRMETPKSSSTSCWFKNNNESFWNQLYLNGS